MTIGKTKPNPDFDLQIEIPYVEQPRTVTLKVIADEPQYLPAYKSTGAACMDLVAKIIPTQGLGNSVTLNNRCSIKFDTGLRMEIPEGYKLCMALRSSLGAQGLVMTNSPAQIDSDYRGPIQVLITNVGRELVKITDGDRIAQCWVEPVYRIIWEQVTELSPTERGEGGFGSTGTK